MIEAYKDFSLNDREGEVWKDIYNYEGLYQISNHGRVKSLPRLVENNICGFTTKERIRKLRIRCSAKGRNNDKKILCIKLRNKVYNIHRLVAEVFIPNDMNYKFVSHINDSLNNHIDNLKWVNIDYISHSVSLNRCVQKVKLKNSNYVGVYKMDYSKSKFNSQKIYQVALVCKAYNINQRLYFKTAEEAAKAYDEFIIKYNLKRKGNFIENRQNKPLDKKD